MKKQKKSKTAPLLRLRPMLAGIVFVVLMISGPLLLVRKQVFINSTSLLQDSLKVDLAAYQKEIINLRLSCTRLSSADRIERIAREKLDLDYPSTSQIYVVHVEAKDRRHILRRTQDIFAFFKKIITGEQS